MANDWASNSFTVYALLRPQSDPDAVASKMTKLVVSHAELEPGTQLSYSLQSVFP